MSDTIYRQQAIDALGEEPEVWEDDDEYGMGQRSEWRYIKKILETLPSAQPERKKGKWLVDEDGNMECPFCGNTCGFGNYCNECGADLRGERNEID